MNMVNYTLNGLQNIDSFMCLADTLIQSDFVLWSYTLSEYGFPEIRTHGIVIYQMQSVNITV